MLFRSYRLISDDKIVVSWRAIWACEKVSEKHPGWFVPLLDDIIQRLLVCQHDGSKRLLLSILYNVPASSPVSVDLLNYCLDHMLAPQESIGVQALSIRMAYQLCKSEPELLKELQLILENADTEYYSTGVKTTIRNKMCIRDSFTTYHSITLPPYYISNTYSRLLHTIPAYRWFVSVRH